MRPVPVMRPRIPTADHVLPYLQGMDERRVYTNFGPLVDALEARYAERHGVRADQVVACANATLGLQGAVAVSPAGRFHVPSWTFPATPLAVVGAGKALAFDDVVAFDAQHYGAARPDFLRHWISPAGGLALGQAARPRAACCRAMPPILVLGGISCVDPKP